MKNTFKIFGIIVLTAVITFALVFTGCSDSDDDDDNSNNSNNGSGGEVISILNADVYYYDYDTESFLLLPSNFSGKVTIWIGSERIEMEEEVGNITGSKLSFTLPDIPAVIASKGMTSADMFEDGYTETWGDTTEVFTVTSKPVFNPTDAKILFGDGLSVKLSRNDWNGVDYVSVSTGQVMSYYYSDKAVTISGTYNTTRKETRVYTQNYWDSQTQENKQRTVTDIYTTNRIDTYSCILKKGWNAVYNTRSYNQSPPNNDDENGSTRTYTYTSTYSTSPGNAVDWKWVYGLDLYDYYY